MFMLSYVEKVILFKRLEDVKRSTASQGKKAKIRGMGEKDLCSYSLLSYHVNYLVALQIYLATPWGRQEPPAGNSCFNLCF